jgi:FkbM family methyltransferase
MSTTAAHADDAKALRRIVEVQAESLVRLRRELTGARQRSAGVPAAAVPKPVLNVGGLGELSEAELLDRIRNAQTDIEAVLVRSRWLRLGRRLGVARPIAWESENWRSPFVNGDVANASPSALRGELIHLARLQDELRRSRWRQLGHKLRVSKPLAWDLAAPAEASVSVVAASPDEQAEAAAAENDTTDQALTHRFLDECKALAVDAVLDIGANAGQFAQRLRRQGWAGHIISFEPLSAAHVSLRAAAKDDPLWDVADRCALGAVAGETEINVAGNSWSSSLLPMSDLHRGAAPSSAYRSRESCPVVTLDDVVANIFSDPTTLLALKIDTQGYERQVLDGLQRHRDKVKVVLCELSLAELYEGGATIVEMLPYLHAAGFVCVGLSPAFTDDRSGRLLQVDGLFIAR